MASNPDFAQDYFFIEDVDDRDYLSALVRETCKALPQPKLKDYFYTTERYDTEVNAREYIEGFHNADYFIKFCQQCRNYSRRYGCPPFDYDPLEYRCETVPTLRYLHRGVLKAIHVMTKDYSSYGPAYRNFKVREDVYVPQPVEEFSADNPFTKMAPIRGELKDIRFDGNYIYLDKSMKFKIVNTTMYFVAWTLAFLLNRIRYGLKIEGREKIRQNQKLFDHGVMTVCNHVYRWDMISVMQAMRFRKAWIPMYAQPFRGKDGFVMKAVGGIAIPEERSGLKAFDEAMADLCAHNKWIHIFPESCSWKFYAPLRPFKIGAFNMAYRHSLPVIPLVISFRPRTGWRKLFSKDEPLITIHVGDPIIPNMNTPRKEETARMRDLAHQTMLDMAGIVSNPWPSSID